VQIVTCMGEVRNAYNNLIEKSEGKRSLIKPTHIKVKLKGKAVPVLFFN